MNIRTIFIVASFLACSPLIGSGQDAAKELEVRRNKQVLHSYVSQLKARTELPAAVRKLATELEVEEEKIKELEQAVPAALSAVVAEFAKRWAADKSARTEAPSFRRSTFLIESSKPWRAMLQRSLTPEQLTKWDAAIDQKHAAEKTLAEQERKAKEETERRQQLANDIRAAAMARMLIVRGILDQDLNTSQRGIIVDGCRAVIRQSQDAARQSLAGEIAWLSDSFGLKEKQARRLSVAMKGVLAKSFGRATSKLDALNNEFEEQAPDQQAESTEELLEIFRTYDVPGTRAGGEFWGRALKSTLSDSQYESYHAERAARIAFARAHDANAIVYTFDKVVRLRIEQRTRLSEALTNFEGELGPVIASLTPRILPGYMNLPDELKMVFDDVLTPQQVEKLSASNLAAPGLRFAVPQ